MKKRLVATATGLLLAVGVVVPGPGASVPAAQADAATTLRPVEYLDRGLVAANLTGGGSF
jgi:hypothetical protein